MRSRMPVVEAVPVWRISQCSIPRHGHAYPSLAVIRKLVYRVHRVTYAINKEFAPQVESAGATPVFYHSTSLLTAEPELVELLGQRKNLITPR
jgi:UDP:flavonoid glycosyltransferase YjiC (YdhE family)